MRKERESNFELLRIIAMFLVLVVHANYFSLGAPSLQECSDNPLQSMFRISVESVSIVCVNVFVLVSGWFGIHFKWKSLVNFLFQVFFFGIGIYLFVVLFLNVHVSLRGIAACFQITTWNWFVKSYLCLYLLSPVLNSFCDNANHKSFLTVILSFFVFQSIYGWTGSANFFLQGYSTISFCGLYLVAQYVKRFVLPKFSRKNIIVIGLILYVVSSLLLLTIEFLSIRFSIPMLSMFSYINPLVILSSISIILIFSQIKMKSRIINWIAASCFAVFLIHTNVNICVPYYKSFVKHIYQNYDGIFCVCLMFVFILTVFILSVLLDQIRKFFWKFINAQIPT